MINDDYGKENSNLEITKNSKLEKKPLSTINPVGNDSHIEDLRKIKEYLHVSGDPAKKKGGVPLLYADNKIYVDSEDSHTLIIGSTGSKKTRLVVLPTVHLLGEAEESMIVCDPKAEVYERTAFSLKEKGYNILVLNFRNPSVGECWNPLEIPFELYKKGEIDRACEFVNDIATNLILAEKSAKDPYFDYCASDLFFGLTFLAFTLSSGRKNISVRDILDLRRKMFLNEDIRDKKLIEEAKKNDLIYHSLLSTINNADSTRACILSMFDQKMRCFMYQKNLLDMMSENTISLDTLSTQKSIIYLIMPDEKTTYHKLISLFVKQSYEYLIFKNQESGTGRCSAVRINYILDEFSSLPTIKDFPNMIAAARSRNIRFNLVIQSLHQLKARYEDEAETIKSNCNNWIYLTSRELELLREISELCGRDNNGKHIFSISSLQHFDKEKGQALILCGRLFPFVSELKDISFYDGNKYEILKYVDRKLYEPEPSLYEPKPEISEHSFVPNFLNRDVFESVSQSDDITEEDKTEEDITEEDITEEDISDYLEEISDKYDSLFNIPDETAQEAVESVEELNAPKKGQSIFSRICSFIASLFWGKDTPAK